MYVCMYVCILSSFYLSSIYLSIISITYFLLIYPSVYPSLLQAQEGLEELSHIEGQEQQQ